MHLQGRSHPTRHRYFCLLPYKTGLQQSIQVDRHHCGALADSQPGDPGRLPGLLGECTSSRTAQPRANGQQPSKFVGIAIQTKSRIDSPTRKLAAQYVEPISRRHFSYESTTERRDVPNSTRGLRRSAAARHRRDSGRVCSPLWHRVFASLRGRRLAAASQQGANAQRPEA